MTERIETLILGHNQFIGVDHLDQQRGAKREGEFADSARILELVRFAHSQGVRGLMVSTHGRLKSLMGAIADDPTLKRDLGIYPIVPYAAGYVRRANEVGLVAMAKEALRGTRASSKFGVGYQALVGLLTGNPNRFISPLVATEMVPFRGVRVDSIILHNVLTDLLLAWNAKSTLQRFDEVIRRRFGVRPAFATFNYPLLATKFAQWRLPRPLVLTSLNPIGFQMNPSREACERELERNRSDVLAMSVLAAGRVDPTQALEYLKPLPGISSLVFGSSTRSHIQDSSTRFRDLFGSARTGFGNRMDGRAPQPVTEHA